MKAQSSPPAVSPTAPADRRLPDGEEGRRVCHRPPPPSNAQLVAAWLIQRPRAISLCAIALALLIGSVRFLDPDDLIVGLAVHVAPPALLFWGMFVLIVPGAFPAGGPLEPTVENEARIAAYQTVGCLAFAAGILGGGVGLGWWIGEMIAGPIDF